MISPTDEDLTQMLREIARVQALLYFQPHENPQPVAVVRSVFMLIVAVVTIQFTRAGLSEEQLSRIDGIPEEIAGVMQSVGWNLTGLEQYYNTD